MSKKKKIKLLNLNSKRKIEYLKLKLFQLKFIFVVLIKNFF
jgi:hypothetical protein